MPSLQNPVDLDTYFNTTLPAFIKKTAQEIPTLLRSKQKKSPKESPKEYV